MTNDEADKIIDKLKAPPKKTDKNVMGYKGITVVDTPYIYAPYIPLMKMTGFEVCI